MTRRPAPVPRPQATTLSTCSPAWCSDSSASGVAARMMPAASSAAARASSGGLSEAATRSMSARAASCAGSSRKTSQKPHSEKVSMTGRQTFEAADFTLQGGATPPAARLVYRTLATLSPARNNVVLIPSWYSGCSSSAARSARAPGRRPGPRAGGDHRPGGRDALRVRHLFPALGQPCRGGADAERGVPADPLDPGAYDTVEPGGSGVLRRGAGRRA